MHEKRLGDVIDDFCVKCRRVTNHSIVSIVDQEAAKVRCRTCYHDHDYRHEQAPPSKKELKKAALFGEVLSNAAGPAAVDVVEGVGASILIIGGLGAFVCYAYAIVVRRGDFRPATLDRWLGELRGALSPAYTNRRWKW